MQDSVINHGKEFEILAWLFPATYLLHIMEEYWCGEGFYRWVSRVVGWEMPPARFLLMNGVAWLLMVASIIWLRRTGAMSWLLVSFATVVSINGLAHLVGTVWTRTYSPGVISGMLIWLPLGATTLVRLRRSATRRAFRAGVFLGLAMHAVLFLLVLLARGF